MADIELPPTFIGYHPLPSANIENVPLTLKIRHHFLLIRLKLAMQLYYKYCRDKGWLTWEEGQWTEDDVCRSESLNYLMIDCE